LFIKKVEPLCHNDSKGNNIILGLHGPETGNKINGDIFSKYHSNEGEF